VPLESGPSSRDRSKTDTAILAEEVERDTAATPTSREREFFRTMKEKREEEERKRQASLDSMTPEEREKMEAEEATRKAHEEEHDKAATRGMKLFGRRVFGPTTSRSGRGRGRGRGRG